MRFSAAVLLGVVGLAAAQSSTSVAASAAPSASGSPSGCGSAIDAIINSCLASTTPQVKACASNDWTCMCNNQKAVVTCYNNCPSDPNSFGAKQQLTSWCNAAEAYPKSSTTYATQKTTGKATSAGAAASSTMTTNNVHTGFASVSGSAAASSSATGAASGFTPAGGLIAAVFGLALL